ncbi:hypothetical protein N0V90_012082 [Kalmusia sp. IMI 367209]|nr:hypothetical protein N0V90_012082 [Kalmusia sp. IMI 367209]
MVSKAMLPALLKNQLSFVPLPQPFYTFHNKTWTSSTQHTITPDPSPTTLSSLALITWNIDFMAPEPQARMASALNHLERLISAIPSSSAVVIFLQEMMETQLFPKDAKDLTQIAKAAWVRARFNVTDLESAHWSSQYGQVTLVDRRLSIQSVTRLHLVSEFERDALFVDVRLNGSEAEQRLLRLCNVHLDSMTGSLRPVQWKGLALHLQDTSSGVVASVLAGDCNANQPRDLTEPQNNGFKDAYLETGGVEDDEAGCTWGFQSIGWERWGRARMDKEVYWGDIEVTGLDRIGVGVRIEDDDARRALEEEETLDFVTDHYGLIGNFHVEGGFQIEREQSVE